MSCVLWWVKWRSVCNVFLNPLIYKITRFPILIFSATLTDRVQPTSMTNGRVVVVAVATVFSIIIILAAITLSSLYCRHLQRGPCGHHQLPQEPPAPHPTVTYVRRPVHAQCEDSPPSLPDSPEGRCIDNSFHSWTVGHSCHSALHIAQRLVCG